MIATAMKAPTMPIRLPESAIIGELRYEKFSLNFLAECILIRRLESRRFIYLIFLKKEWLQEN
jgi:hypothetical protein